MKIKIIQLFLSTFSIAVILSGCDNNNNSGLVFLNDMDMAVAWNDHPASNLIISDNAHSGRYVCQMDTMAAYSPTFYKQVKTISATPLKKLEIEGWVNIKGVNCLPTFVLDIRDINEHPIGYVAQNVNPVSDDEDKWVHVSFTYDLTEKNRNASDNYLRIYVINNTKDGALLDDLKLSFE